MSVSSTELAVLAASHDIVSLGMIADEARRERHGMRTTFVRVAAASADLGVPVVCPPAAGEMRIEGAPASARAAVDRVREVVTAARGVPVSAFSLADLEQFATDGTLTLRALLEELRAAGLELIAEAPVDRLKDARRSIEEVNIAGLALARLTVHRLPAADALPLFTTIADLQRRLGFIRAFAPLPRSANPAVPTTGYEDVKRVALARLVVDNIPSIQVDWSLYGPKLGGRLRACGAERAFRHHVRMTAVRLGAVGYLNARPLVVGLNRSPRFTLRYDVPSECARLLHAGDIDVGLVPSIEYTRGNAYRIVPDLAIMSDGPVASVALFSTRPIADIRSTRRSRRTGRIWKECSSGVMPRSSSATTRY
jgi:hypothetical protein